VTYFSRYGQQEWLDGLNHNESEMRVQRLADETANLVTALNRAIVSGHLEMATRNFMATARVLNMKGDPEQIIELAQLILRQPSLSPTNRIRVQLTRSTALRLSGKINRAGIAATWLLALAEENGEPRLYADCLVEAAQLRIEEGQQEVAENYLENARRIYTAIGSAHECARVLTLLGKALIQHGEYQNANLTLQRALSTHRDNSNRLGEADTILQMGILATREKRYAQTHAYLDQAEELYDLADDRQGKMAALFARGELHHEEERRESAEEILKEALHYATQLKAPHWEASILGALGAVYLSSRNLSAARNQLERAESILRHINTPHRFALVLAYKGELDRLTGESTKAWHSLNDAAVMSGAFGTLPNTNVSRVIHRLHGALSGQSDHDATVEVSAIF
jgi:tetratricopeptide (TPR) repeat protein